MDETILQREGVRELAISVLFSLFFLISIAVVHFLASILASFVLLCFCTFV